MTPAYDGPEVRSEMSTSGIVPSYGGREAAEGSLRCARYAAPSCSVASASSSVSPLHSPSAASAAVTDTPSCRRHHCRSLGTREPRLVPGGSSPRAFAARRDHFDGHAPLPVQGNGNRHGGARYCIIEGAFSERAMHVVLAT